MPVSIRNKIPQLIIDFQDVFSYFYIDTSSEIYLLELMFNDIASRASKPGIIREHFDNFFHLNGLWGDEMFKTFDTNHDGFITFEQFLTSIDIMVKGTF